MNPSPTDQSENTPTPPAPQPRATLILPAGAPTSPLMSGALAAIYDRGKTFNTFFTSGGGGLSGAVFVAPKHGTAPEALAQGILTGIEEPIYDVLPVPYKSFFKPGPLSALFQTWARMFHVPAEPLGPASRNARLYNDLVDLFFSTWSPSTLNLNSKGLCAPFPLLGDFIDFDKLKAFKGDFFFNAYNITLECMENFPKEKLTKGHCHAAIAFPLIYPPKKIGEYYYLEGADVDPLNLPTLVNLIEDDVFDPGTVVHMDALGGIKQALVRNPKNIIDAWSVSAFAPVVKLAELHYNLFMERGGLGGVEMLQMTFDVPRSDFPTVMDWSHGNLSRLWYIGQKAGHEFCDEHSHLLPDREPNSSNPVT